MKHSSTNSDQATILLAAVRQMPLQLSNLLAVAARSSRYSFFVPSFLVSKLQRSNGQHGGVSSLDGLRGLACLFVVHEHILYNYSMTFVYRFGHEGTHYLVQWPVIRIFWSGTAMVNIFFLISGYVLTYKPFAQIHRGEIAAARATISSSTFRRVPRLYLPMWFMLLVTAILTWLTLFNRSIDLYESNNNPYHLHESLPLYFTSFWSQMKDFWANSWKTFNIFKMEDSHLHAEHYDRHTWTIPVEFRCSMILFAVMSAIIPFKMRYRTLVISLVTVCVISMKQLYTAMFLIGAALADFDHFIRGTLHRFRDELNSGTMSTMERFIVENLHPESKTHVVLFAIGIYVICVPVYFSEDDPFYSLLVQDVPLKQFAEGDRWLRLYGAILIVWPVANSTILRPVFVNPVATYLGKISFALYLVHGNLIRMLLYPAIPIFYKITGDGTRENQTATQMTISFFFGYLLIVPLSIYLADLFWRGVDAPVTRWGRRLELTMMQDDQHSGSPLK